MDDRELTILVVASLVLVFIAGFVAISLGLIDMPRNGFHDGPDVIPPDTIDLEQMNTSQTLPFWTTEFLVEGIRGETVYPLDNLTFAVIEEGDAVRTDVNFTFHDMDGDGNASMGDVLLVSNMTDDLNGSDLEVYLDGTYVAGEGISWDVNDPLIYSMFLYWNYPVDANGSKWDTDFSITHLGIPFDVLPSNLSFDVLGEDLAQLEDAHVVLRDMNGDGLLSNFDRVHIFGMTEEYQRASVRMYLDGTLVAIGTVPQWIF